MSNKEELTTLMPNISSISSESTLQPTMPVSIYTQEAENMEHIAREHLVDLVPTGIDVNFLDDYLLRLGACRAAEAIWESECRMREEAETQWHELSPMAYDLRDRLIRTYRYVFRKNDDVLQTVRDVADGSGHADMIQDLATLAIVGEPFLDVLAPFNITAETLQWADQMSDDIAALLAAANGDKVEDREAKILRDKAYTYLKESVDELKAACKFTFWDQPHLYKAFISPYWKKMNKKKNEPEVPEEDLWTL